MAKQEKIKIPANSLSLFIGTKMDADEIDGKIAFNKDGQCIITFNINKTFRKYFETAPGMDIPDDQLSIAHLPAPDLEISDPSILLTHTGGAALNASLNFVLSGTDLVKQQSPAFFNQTTES